MERRYKCEVCGKVFCYSDQDVENALSAAKMSALSSIGSIAGALSGNWMAANVNNNNANHESSKITDFSHCPNCHSTQIHRLNDEDWELEKLKQNSAQVTVSTTASVESLIKRIELFLEEGDWTQAWAYCDYVLDSEPENAYVYILKQLSIWKSHNWDEAVNSGYQITTARLYPQIERFATEDIKQKIYEAEEVQKQKAYSGLVSEYETAKDIQEYSKVADELKAFIPYEKSEYLYEECQKKIHELKEEDRKDRIEVLLSRLTNAYSMEHGSKIFSEIEKDATEDEMERAKIIFENLAGVKKKEKKRDKWIAIVSVVFLVAITVMGILWSKKTESDNYNKGIELLNAGNYTGAIECFNKGKGEDIDKYIKYCEIAKKIHNIPKDTCLSNLIEEIEALNNFNNANELINRIPHIDGIQSKMNSWWIDNNYSKGTNKAYMQISVSYKLSTRYYVNGELHDQSFSEIYWDPSDSCWVNHWDDRDWFNNPNYSGSLYTEYKGNLK